MEFDVVPVLLFPWLNKALIRNVLVLFWIFDSILWNTFVICTKSYTCKIYIGSFALQIVNLSVPSTCDFYFLFLINLFPSLFFYPLKMRKGNIFLNVFANIFFFFRNHSRITELQGKRVHSFKSSPLHIGSSRTRMGNFQFPTASR